jgi:hypothetical protein
MPVDIAGCAPRRDGGKALAERSGGERVGDRMRVIGEPRRVRDLRFTHRVVGDARDEAAAALIRLSSDAAVVDARARRDASRDAPRFPQPGASPVACCREVR